MNRRQLLMRAGAAAVAAQIPVLVVARTYAPPGLKTTEAIDSVFQIMDDYGFHEIDSKAGLFSYYPRQFQSLDEFVARVRKVMLDWGGRDHWDRVDYMLTIRQKLEKRFGDDLSAHIAWLDAPHSDLGGKTPRQMMSSLHFFHMARVADLEV